MGTTTDGRKTDKLSRLDWIEAGYALLADRGVGAVRIPALAARLGSTKGSFYWHFDDIADLRSALIERWGRARTSEVIAAVSDDDADPRSRLRRLGRASRQIGPIDREMRAWARRDASAQAAVEAADGELFAALESAVEELGHSGDDARTRALILFLTGVGMSAVDHQIGSQPISDLGNTILGVVTRSPSRAPHARAAQDSSDSKDQEP